MLDFAFSVPPVWMASEPGVSWGLADGFSESNSHGFHASSRHNAACKLHGAANDDGAIAADRAVAGRSEHSDWAGLNDVAQSFARMWDEIDYGVMLLSQDAQLLYANHVARHELATFRGLGLVGYALVAGLEEQQMLLGKCVQDAARGKRSLQEFGKAEPLAVSFLPLEGQRMDESQARYTGTSNGSSAHAKKAVAMQELSHNRVMAIMGKRQVCEELSFQMFSRLYGLTPAETAVLLAICNGQTAEETAAKNQVAVSTVRTQLNQVRAKTGARSLREVARRVASLPPLVPALRPLA